MIKSKIIANISIFLATLPLFSQNSLNFKEQCNLWILDYNANTPYTYSTGGMVPWISIQTPVTSQISDICFSDSLIGFASHLQYGALRTTNSGVNWDIISFNDTNFFTGYNGICFVNNSTGWAVGGATQIRKTTNGGLNWFKQYAPPVSGILRTVYFISPNTGYAAGSKNFPWIPFACKTINGGENWTEISPSFAGAQELNDQYWQNGSTGWLCGYDVLAFTTDGGNSYTNLFSNIPPSSNGHIALLSVQFINSQTGWMGAANLERNNVYKTTNGGANWFFQSNPISSGGMNQINDVKFINPNIGWAVHGTPTSGAIMFTSNGGVNWSIEENSVNWFECIETFQNTKAWVGSSNGKIWYNIPQNPLAVGNENQIPAGFLLSQNYPNPFNPATKISFQIPKAELTKLIVYDVLGRKVSEPVNKRLSAGTYEIHWDAANYPSGIYYYRLSAGDFSSTKKMILVK